MAELSLWANLSPLQEWSLAPLIVPIPITGTENDFWVTTAGVSIGVLCALVGGYFCPNFLDSVTAPVPEEIRLPQRDEYAGARELGNLEILLYFLSLYLQQYLIAGGWIAFKVGAKWAAWQHIARIPEKNSYEYGDTYLVLRDRLRLSNRLLGKFLNGTLYNGFCAAVGYGIANGIAMLGRHCHFYLSLWPLGVPLLAIAIAATAVGVTFWLLFFYGPDREFIEGINKTGRHELEAKV